MLMPDPAEEISLIEKFINTIKEDPNFQDSFQNIKFINSFRQTIQNQQTFTFKIQAKLKKPSKKKRKAKK